MLSQGHLDGADLVFSNAFMLFPVIEDCKHTLQYYVNSEASPTAAEWDIGCNPNHVYSKVSLNSVGLTEKRSLDCSLKSIFYAYLLESKPTKLNGPYSKVSEHTVTALGCIKCHLT